MAPAADSRKRAPVAPAETVHLDPLHGNRLLGQRDPDLDDATGRDGDRFVVARVAETADREFVGAGGQVVEGEEAQPVGECHVLAGGIARRAEDGGCVLEGDCDLGANPAPDGRVEAGHLGRRPGDDDHLGAEFDVPKLGALQHVVEGASDVQCGAGAGDEVAGG